MGDFEAGSEEVSQEDGWSEEPEEETQEEEESWNGETSQEETEYEEEQAYQPSMGWQISSMSEILYVFSCKIATCIFWNKNNQDYFVNLYIVELKYCIVSF